MKKLKKKRIAYNILRYIAMFAVIILATLFLGAVGSLELDIISIPRFFAMIACISAGIAITGFLFCLFHSNYKNTCLEIENEQYIRHQEKILKWIQNEN